MDIGKLASEACLLGVPPLKEAMIGPGGPKGIVEGLIEYTTSVKMAIVGIPVMAAGYHTDIREDLRPGATKWVLNE